MQEIDRIKQRLEELPKGTLIYKNINGKQQPYLQSTVNGKSVSYYIKVNERHDVLLQIEEREELKNRLKHLNKYSSEVIKILQNNPFLDRDINIGAQDLYGILDLNKFYVDKTEFIYEWWTKGDPVTLITRPRRFGKTLMLNTVKHFFSNLDEGPNRFERLSVCRHESMKQYQRAYPVIFLTLADLKNSFYDGMMQKMNQIVRDIYREYECILGQSDNHFLSELYEIYCTNPDDISEHFLIYSIRNLSEALHHHYGIKPIILLDEYDTPLQEAYLRGFYEEMAEFMRQFFGVTFKTNNHYERSLITGITKISKNSMFSDMNNLVTASLIDDNYATYFGFTENEVKDALTCLNSDEMAKVKEFYDGFTIGKHTDIYNPWSIVHFLSNKAYICYWVNTASTDLISRLVLQGDKSVKDDVATLLSGHSIRKTIDENVSFNYLNNNGDGLWMLLFYTGYLKADNVDIVDGIPEGDLSLTNQESYTAFKQMVDGWFRTNQYSYNSFIKALLHNDVDEINLAMNEVAYDMVSFFDVGRRPSEKSPERFYHGLVLGMLVDLKDRYRITSNRESGRGRYDIMMEPLDQSLPGIIIEFKVRDEAKEHSLDETANNALSQIKNMNYKSELVSRGIDEDRISCYGFAFEGKDVLVKCE